MADNEVPIEQIREYLRELTPQARIRLLTEIERLQLCGDDMPGSEAVLLELRAEFRKNGPLHDRVGNPARYFFEPLDLLLVNRSPEDANAGQVSRGSLSAIWEWISRNLMPTMARDYSDKMKQMLAVNNQHEAKQLAAIFQTKAIKYLEGTLASGNGPDHTRAGLATYTSARGAFDDVAKMLRILRCRDTLAEFNNALPTRIDNFEGTQLAKVRGLLDALAAKNAEALPFALTLVAKHLKTPWQLLRLATKAADSKAAASVAETPYALAISMVLDQLDDKRLELRKALQSNRIPIAKDLLVEIYDIEYAVRVRLDSLAESDWGKRLDAIMAAIDKLLETEISDIPDDVRHVLGSRRLHSHDSLTGRLTYFAYRGRDVLTGGAAFCKNLAGFGQKSAG